MSDIQTVELPQLLDEVDVEDRGNSLRVATNTPHLISLGCGRFSTAVTIHPLRQGGVTLGSDPSSNIVIQGTGVQTQHCRIENSNGVVTLYPLTGDTLIDGIKVETPTRLSQGCMIGIGRSNYLRFNHPAEANLMKSVLPNTRISMAPIQFLPNENYSAPQTNQTSNTKEINNQTVQNQSFNNADDKERIGRLVNTFSSYKGQIALENELDMLNKEIGKKKPPVAPRRMFRDLDQTSNSSNSDQELLRGETPPKTNSIMSKVSKFEYYLKNSQRSGNKNQQTNEMWSPKVFSSNSLTVNTPAKDVLNGKNVPSSYKNAVNTQTNGQKTVILNKNNAVEAKNCSYTNVIIKNQAGKVEQISRNFDSYRNDFNPPYSNGQNGNKPSFKIQTPSPNFNRNPVFNPSIHDKNHSNTTEQSSESYRRPQYDENQRSLDQARIDEILNMCAEYEKQNSVGIPTTPTEKKTPNKIITNGSLPRGFQNNLNLVQSPDGYYRSCVPNSPNSPKSNNIWMNYENAKSFAQDCRGQQIPAHHLNFENVQPEVQMITAYRQENFVQNVRQFPITELSSPVMIRKIARNAQNSSNYVTNYDTDRSKMFISPYENVLPGNHGFVINGVNPTPNYVPKSPGSNSPRTRIKTTYAHRNPPQHFVFPSPQSPVNDNSKSHGIEKQLSLTEDIPMIDDTDFANELEMRIARLNPENREKPAESPDKFILDPLEAVYGGNRRNFEEIKRDLIADIPELDAIQKDLDRDLSNSSNVKSSNNENLKEFSEKLRNVPLEDEVFETMSSSTPNTSVLEENRNIITTVVSIEVPNTNKEIGSFVAEENVECTAVSDEIEEKTKEINEESAKLDVQNEKLNQLENLYSIRKKIMNDMKDIKTEIHDFELSRKQAQSEIDDFEMRMEELQDEIQVQRDIRKDEIEVATVSEAEKIKFKIAQEQRQAEMKEMQKKLEIAEEEIRRIENDFSRGQATLEELRHAQEMLENDKKLFEDMEFQHLEKESEFYSRLSREQNVLQNDLWGTTKKIEKLENLLHEMKMYDMNLSEKRAQERNDADNPTLKKLLDSLITLENDLSTVNRQINDLKREMGIFRNVDKSNDIENYKARIRSGDFSPPTSDEDDMNEVKDRVKSSIDQMSMSMIVHPKTNLKELYDDQTFKIVNNKVPVDPMSQSMIIDTKSDLKKLNDNTVNNRHSADSSKLEQISEKKGFWERNFDSLSRLKGKDKNKKVKSQDLMSQSLNENMFYNNDNIESEYGSFDKFNSLTNKKNKDSKNKNDDTSKSMISSLTNLSKIIRKDSSGKKNKEDTTKNTGDDKENIDVNVEAAERHEDVDGKNSKHRYLKNAKSGASDNKYANRSKLQQNMNGNHEDRMNLDDNRNSFADSLEDEDYRLIDSSGNVLRNQETKNKIAYRKSDGDEMRKYLDSPKNMCDNVKIPSQDDIDRISKVTLDAPLLFDSGEMTNTLGRKTLDSLRELERNRLILLEQKGCQVIENEREKISELKRRVQSETLQKWEEKQKLSLSDGEKSPEMDSFNNTQLDNSKDSNDRSISGSQRMSGVELDGSGSIDAMALLEKPPQQPQQQQQHQQTRHSDPYKSSNHMDDDRNRQSPQYNSTYPMIPLGHVVNNTSRPLSEMSDMSSENGASPPLVEAPRRARKVSSNSLNSSFGWSRNREDRQRPLTRYLPIDNDDLNLRQHIESAGHQVDECPHIIIDSTSCRGYLHKLGAKFHGWSKRWFVFDRSNKTLIYYSDKNEKKPRGGAYFQVIEEVYLDHLNASKSPTPLTTFVLKTRQRRYYLMAPSGPAARIWIDVIFTGAQGYTEYMQ